MIKYWRNKFKYKVGRIFFKRFREKEGYEKVKKRFIVIASIKY